MLPTQDDGVLSELASKEAEENMKASHGRITATLKDMDKELPFITGMNSEGIVHWGFKWGQAIVDAIGENCACINKCSHCCYQAVFISKAEATEIAKFTGREMADVGVPLIESIGLIEESREKYTTKPCPFLKDGSCSIYEVRPIACRVNINLSKQSSLCDTVNHPKASVPYAAIDGFHDNILMALGLMHPAEDIRGWFPE